MSGGGGTPVVPITPLAEPVTLADVYDHLRLTPLDSPPVHPLDALLTRNIASARGDAERITKRAFIAQALRLYFSGFPYGTWYPYYVANQALYGYAGQRFGSNRRNRRSGAFELLRPPLISVTSVKYYDAANVLQTLADTNYYVTDDLLVQQIRFVDGFSPPDVFPRPDAVRVDYVAGYPPNGSDYAANVPPEIKNAILLGVELLTNPLKPDERAALESARDSLLVGFTVTTL